MGLHGIQLAAVSRVRQVMEASLHALVLLAAPAIAIAVCIRHAESPSLRRVVWTTLSTLLGMFLFCSAAYSPSAPVWQMFIPALCGMPLILFVRKEAPFIRTVAVLAVICIGLCSHHARLAGSREYTAWSFVSAGRVAVAAPRFWHSDLTRIYGRPADLNPPGSVPSHN